MNEKTSITTIKREIKKGMLCADMCGVKKEQICFVKAEVQNLTKRDHYQFYLQDKEQKEKHYLCILNPSFAMVLGVPEKGRVYDFFLAPYGNDDRYFVFFFMTEDREGIFGEYLQRVNRKPDVEVLLAYLQYSDEQKRSVEEQQKVKKYVRTDTNLPGDTVFFQIPELRCKYELTKEHYPPEQRRYIEGMFRRYESSGDSKEKQHAQECLKYYLSINTRDSTIPPLDIQKIRRMVKKSFYGMEAVTRRIIEILVAGQKKGNSSCRILLVGNPGTGKTGIVHAVSEAIGRKLILIEGSAMQSGLDLLGTDYSYDKAEPGQMATQLLRMGNMECTVLIDELDKMGRDARDGDCMNALISLLEGYDTYLEGRLDVRNTIFMATANSLYGIPDAVLNRFEIIRIPDYDFETKVKIAEKYTLPDLLKQYGIGGKTLKIHRSVLEILARNYCGDAGMRDIKRYLEKMIQKVIVLFREKKQQKVTISAGNYKVFLEEEPDRENLRIRYNAQCEKYDSRERVVMEELFSKLNSPYISTQEKKVIRKKLKYHLDSCPENESTEKTDLRELYRILETTHFGMRETKKAIIRAYAAQKQPCFRFLLYGPMGTGKTSLVNAMGKALGMPVIRINCNGLQDVSVLKGFLDSWSRADSGAVIKGMAEHGTRRVLIHLDELDKTARGKNGEVEAVFMELLDDSKIWHDLFLDYPVSLDSVSFIATANDPQRISPVLLDRFRMIPITGYEPWEKRIIALNYILPRILRECGYENLNICLENEGIEYLTEICKTESGVRGLERGLRTAVEALIEEHIHTGETEFSITRSLVEKEIGIYLTQDEAGPGKKECAHGIARLLTVCQGVGEVACVEATLLEQNEIMVTGNVEEDIRESVQVIRTLVEDMTRICGKGIHVHYGNLGQKKEGPSGGVSTFVAVYSAYTFQKVPMNMAFTGEVTLKGYITSVGAVKEKILAAENYGCSKIFLPERNFYSLPEQFRKMRKIELVPVNHVQEIVEVLFKSENLNGIVKTDRTSCN